MSMMGGTPRAEAAAVGEAVARFSEYEGAQKAVSKLIAAEVPARDIAIVGIGLRSIERITGRLGYATAARSGAINGLLLGLFLSAILVFGAPTMPIQVFVGVMLVGIAIGMLLSIVTYSFVRRRRDFASTMQVLADHYDVTVADQSIRKARQVLGQSGVLPPVQPAAPVAIAVPEPTAPEPTAPDPSPALPHDAAEPPRYGERVVPPVPAEPAPRQGEGHPVGSAEPVASVDPALDERDPAQR